MRHASDHAFDKEYWDGLWRGGRGSAMSAGPPNPHLMREIGDLTPGSALEAGCGAGTEAIWLASRGWRVTGVDIAADALARAARKAAAGHVARRLRWIEADLSTWEPDARFDLVTTHYAHPAMPQLTFYDRIASWVAPGGTLFIVGHLRREHHDPDHHAPAAHGRAHDHRGTEPPDSASATAEAITARLDQAVWEIATAREAHRTLTGTDGRETSVHDVVVKALRRP